MSDTINSLEQKLRDAARKEAEARHKPIVDRLFKALIKELPEVEHKSYFEDEVGTYYALDVEVDGTRHDVKDLLFLIVDAAKSNLSEQIYDRMTDELLKGVSK